MDLLWKGLTAGFYQLASTGWLLPASTDFYRLLLASTGFYRLLPASDGFYQLLPASSQFYRLLLDSTRVYRSLPDSTGFYRNLPDSTGFYWILPDSAVFKFYKYAHQRTFTYYSNTFSNHPLFTLKFDQMWIFTLKDSKAYSKFNLKT